jgi:hypothetical protein
MALFSRETRVDLEGFCRDYYETAILNPVGVATDFSAAYLNEVRRSVAEADGSFSRVTTSELSHATIPLGFELLALAWYDKFGDKSAIQQSVFTKGYLQVIKREDIWRDSEPYNQAVARSVVAGKDSDRASSRFSVGFVTNMRVELFKEYHEAGYDDECVARVLNRLMFGGAWQSTATPVALSFALTDRLGFPIGLNDEAGFRLTAVVLSCYKGARRSLDKVRIRC